MSPSTPPLFDALLAAQEQAERLFDAIVEAALIAPGRRESDINRGIFQLAKERFGIQRFWHKRIVRVGANTALPYRATPPDTVMGDDDIAFIDLGPVFGDDEADFGRTYVTGNNPDKQRMLQDLPRLFAHCRDFYLAKPSMTGAELYAEAQKTCDRAGWVHGHIHAGHIIGCFPHEQHMGDGLENYICADNHLPMDAPSATGERRHWVLEMHALHPSRAWGGFVEELLV